MIRRILLGACLPLAVLACSGPDRRDLEPADAAAVRALGRQVARSIWGVVPDPPRHKKDLRPELIRGSAVAVGDDALLASCRVVAGRKQVGLVRHRKYRMARVVRPARHGQLCLLRVADAPLNVAQGFRSFADLREGEPLYAILSRTSADYELAEGQLAAKRGRGDRFLETTLLLPPRGLSAVLFDAGGNLVGLGSGGPTADSVVTAVPLEADLVPRLARRDLGGARQAAWPPVPIRRPRPWLLVLSEEPDRDSDAARGVIATVPENPAGVRPPAAAMGQPAGIEPPDVAGDDPPDGGRSGRSGAGPDHGGGTGRGGQAADGGRSTAGNGPDGSGRNVGSGDAGGGSPGGDGGAAADSRGGAADHGSRGQGGHDGGRSSDGHRGGGQGRDGGDDDHGRGGGRGDDNGRGDNGQGRGGGNGDGGSGRGGDDDDRGNGGRGDDDDDRGEGNGRGGDDDDGGGDDD